MLNGDINKLDGQIRKISVQMKSSNTEPDVAAQMDEFLPVSHTSNYQDKILHRSCCGGTGGKKFHIQMEFNNKVF